MNLTLLATSLWVALVPMTPAPPQVWEMDVDKPTLQVNQAADAVRGMTSGQTCRLGKRIFDRFGGSPQRNNCSLALETKDGLAWYGYCAPNLSYLVQIDLKRCTVEELTQFHNQRLTGTVVLDEARKLVLFSHLGGTYAYRGGVTLPVASFPRMAIYSKHEFYSDPSFVYLLNTTDAHPVLHRLALDTLRETRVNLGKVMVLDYAGGRLLLRGVRDPQAFGLYDAKTRTIVQRWRSPAHARAHFVGDGWIAFWTRPAGSQPGDWILVNAVSGESVFYGHWRGRKPPSVTWKGRVLYAGRRVLLAADKARPVRTPLLRIGASKT